MSLLLSKIKGNRYVLPLLVTFSYLLVTKKNSISNSIIVYSNSIGNRVTVRIWSRERIIRTNLTYYCMKTQLPRYLLKKSVFSICNGLTKGNQKVTRKQKVTGVSVTSRKIGDRTPAGEQATT
jgi:hypothetical protein